jgi:hypothetical protein
MGGNSTLEWTKLTLTAIGGTLALVVGLIQYVSTSSLSVRQPFLAKQTELCLSASEHAARLATTKDREQWKKSREEFWMLYWGPLAVVEEAGTQSDVAKKMQAFGDLLKEVPQNTDASQPTLPLDDLRGPAIDIARACESLLTSKWQAGIMSWVQRWFGY